MAHEWKLAVQRCFSYLVHVQSLRRPWFSWPGAAIFMLKAAYAEFGAREPVHAYRDKNRFS